MDALFNIVSLGNMTVNITSILISFIAVGLLYVAYGLMKKVLDNRSGYHEIYNDIVSHDPRDYVADSEGNPIFRGDICSKTGEQIFRRKNRP